MNGKIEFFETNNKNKRRFFSISEELKPYLENILDRNDVNYFYRGPNKINVPLSGTQFHKFVIRAKCEKLNDEEHLSEEETYFVSKLEPIWMLSGLGYNYFREYPTK